MKFLIDMPLSPGLAVFLAETGHDAIHASLVGLSETGDKEILQYAAAEQRTIITADLDFPRLLALMQALGPGLVLFRGCGLCSEYPVKTRRDGMVARPCVYPAARYLYRM